MCAKGQCRPFHNCMEHKTGISVSIFHVINHVNRLFLFTLSLFLEQQQHSNKSLLESNVLRWKRATNKRDGPRWTIENEWWWVHNSYRLHNWMHKCYDSSSLNWVRWKKAKFLWNRWKWMEHGDINNFITRNENKPQMKLFNRWKRKKATHSIWVLCLLSKWFILFEVSNKSKI